MEKSAREMTFEDLLQLNDEEKLYECDIIQNSFRNVPTDVSGEESETIIRHCDDEEGLKGKIRALISEICDNISGCQIRKPGGEVVFIPYTPLLAGKRIQSDVVCSAEAAGMLYLACDLGFLIGQDMLTKAVYAVKNQIESWEREDERYLRATLGLDVCTGVAALIISLDKSPRTNELYAKMLELIAKLPFYISVSSSKSCATCTKENCMTI